MHEHTPLDTMVLKRALLQEVQLVAVPEQVRHLLEQAEHSTAPLSKYPPEQTQKEGAVESSTRKFKELQAVQPDERAEEQLRQVEAQGWQTAETPLS